MCVFRFQYLRRFIHRKCKKEKKAKIGGKKLFSTCNNKKNVKQQLQKSLTLAHGLNRKQQLQTCVTI